MKRKDGGGREIAETRDSVLLQGGRREGESERGEMERETERQKEWGGGVGRFDTTNKRIEPYSLSQSSAAPRTHAAQTK